MRMMPLFAVVVALGLSLMVLGGLGVSDHFGDDGSTGLEQEIEDQSGAAENESVDPEEGDDTGFLSFVIGGAGVVRDLAGIVLFLPGTLESIGVPGQISTAIGHATQLIILLGIVQLFLQWEIR